MIKSILNLIRIKFVDRLIINEIVRYFLGVSPTINITISIWEFYLKSESMFVTFDIMKFVCLVFRCNLYAT